MTTLRLATRASPLAMAQARLVVALLVAAHPGLAVELVTVTTAGDRDQRAVPPGSGWFTTAIQDALRRGEAEVAVHSYKDLPTARAPALVIAAVPAREDPRDALVSRGRLSLGALPPGAAVGTGSPRREAQLRAVRPDLDVRPIRGNVDTRLRRVDEGAYHAVVVAAAGLQRLGRLEAASQIFTLDEMLPAPAQGALAVECSEADTNTRALLAAIDEPDVRIAVEAERAFLAALEAGCRFPAAAHATLEGAELRLAGLVAGAGGLARAAASGPPSAAVAIGQSLARDLIALTSR